MRPHWLIRVEGHIGQTNKWFDQWSIGARIVAYPSAIADDPTLVANPMLTTQLPDAMKARGVAWATALIANGSIAPNVHVDGIKANFIGYDGKYADPSMSHTFRAGADFDPFGGGGSTNYVAAHTAAVISLRTTVSRGKAAKGRIYLPCPVMALDDMASWSPTACDALANDAVTAYEALSFVEGAGAAELFWRPAVVATAPNGPAGTSATDLRAASEQRGEVPAWVGAAVYPPARPIRHVAVGSRPDVQQRRSQKQPEIYSLEPLTYA